jgi:hypothetical protein
MVPDRRSWSALQGKGENGGVERVLVPGCGGSGKSAFARRLGVRTGLPVVELDSVFWPAGVPRSRRWGALTEGRLSEPWWGITLFPWWK